MPAIPLKNGTPLKFKTNLEYYASHVIFYKCFREALEKPQNSLKVLRSTINDTTPQNRCFEPIFSHMNIIVLYIKP